MYSFPDFSLIFPKYIHFPLLFPNLPPPFPTLFPWFFLILPCIHSTLIFDIIFTNLVLDREVIFVKVGNLVFIREVQWSNLRCSWKPGSYQGRSPSLHHCFPDNNQVLRYDSFENAVPNILLKLWECLQTITRCLEYFFLPAMWCTDMECDKRLTVY